MPVQNRPVRTEKVLHSNNNGASNINPQSPLPSQALLKLPIMLDQTLAKLVFSDGEWREFDDPEMQAREQKAMQDARDKAKRVSIPYNKGGYQYISDPNDTKHLGRK